VPAGAADASAQRGVHQRSDHLFGHEAFVAAIHALAAADELLAEGAPRGMGMAI
jgi:hypothetical protein